MDGYGCSGSLVLHAVEASKASSNSMMFPKNRGEDCSNLWEALAQFWECIYPLVQPRFESCIPWSLKAPYFPLQTDPETDFAGVLHSPCFSRIAWVVLLTAVQAL